MEDRKPNKVAILPPSSAKTFHAYMTIAPRLKAPWSIDRSMAVTMLFKEYLNYFAIGYCDQSL